MVSEAYAEIEPERRPWKEKCHCRGCGREFYGHLVIRHCDICLYEMLHSMNGKEYRRAKTRTRDVNDPGGWDMSLALDWT